METVKLQVEVELATSIRPFIDPMLNGRRIGMVYYQKISDGGFITRTITKETDEILLKASIKQGKIYFTKTIIAEQS